MFRRHNCTISQINTVLTPNNLPVTNFPIAVVDVTVYQICLSGEDGYLASWLCGIENLSGKLGSLHVRVTPPERSVTVMVNGREYEAADDTLIPLLETDIGAPFAVILGSGANRHVYNGAAGNVGLYGHCSSHNNDCCGWCDGCGLNAGDFNGGGGSAWFAMGLGRSNPKTANGVIHFRREAGPLTANSSLLRTLVPSTTTVERDAGGDLRSIRTASHLFTVDSVANGLLITTTNLSERRLEARCLLTNPNGDTNRLEISGGRFDGQQHTFAFAWNPDNTTWTFQNGASDDPNRTVESIRIVTNSTGNIVEERRIFDTNNTLLRRTTTEYQLYDNTRLPLRQTIHAAAEGDDSWSDITESMEYYDDPNEAGSYHRLARRQHSDGSWEWLAYDPLGRTALHASPWLDGAAPPSYASDPFSFPSARVITNSYISLDPTLDDLTIRPTTPRTTAEYIITANGTPRLMSRQWHLFTTTNWYGEIVISEISERAATATALFGDPGNQRTVTISYPEAVGDWRSGRTLSTLRPDGTLTTTWHEAGEAAADGTYFEPGGTASHRRAITVSGTAHHPYGLPQRTLIHTEVSDMHWDRLLLSETHVVASPAHPTATDEHALIDWTLHTYDNNGRRLTSHYADGTVESNLWDCCHLTATIGRDGTERRFGYDSMGRRFRDEESSIASLPGSNGHRPASDTAYDALGRVTKTTRRVLRPDGTAAPGYTPLVARTIYQNLTEGDIVTIDEKGRETVSSSDSWGDSRWGDGIPYSLSRSYADGSPAHEESFWSSNIATDTPWDQGEISHWQSWDESVSADGVLVRHSRSGGSIYDFSLQQQIYHADFIESETVEETFTGRVISTARPGYGGATIKTVNHYDGGGRVTAVETWSEIPTDSTLLSRTIYTYDELGQPLLTCQDLDLDGTIDPAGADRISGSDTRYLLINGDWWHQHTSWIYPEADFLLPLTNAITRTRLTGLGVSATDGLLTSETISFDALGNATTERVYTDPTTCRVTRHTTRPGVATPAITISIAGHVISTTAPDGTTVTFTYDGFGRMVAESGPRDALRLTSYNAVGDIAWNGVVVGSVTNITRHQFDYESSGLYTIEIDPLGKAISRDYAPNGTPNYVHGNAAKFAAYTHDPFGRMTTMNTIRDEEELDTQDTTRWAYDAPTGLLTAKTYADGYGTAYDYTPNGKLASRTWARNLTTDYTYDTAHNLTAISYNDVTPNVTFSHDRFGRVTNAVTVGVSANLYAYSHTGLLTNETVTLYSSTPSCKISRPHDSLGRPAGLTLDPPGESQSEGAAPYTVTYGYDEHGRLNSLHASVQSSDITFTYNYLPNSSLITSVASSLGASFKRTYEPHRDLITAVTNHWNGTPVSSFAYVNDAIGRRTRRLDDGTVTNVFDYNGCSELTGAAMGTNAYSYAYDGIGNALWTTNNGIGTAYYTNPLNQYTNIVNSVTLVPQYDLDGNMTATGDGWHYAWNGENRLIVASNDTAQVAYAYDHRSRMVYKTIGTIGLEQDKTITYLWDDYNIIAETVVQGCVTSVTCNVWGLDLLSGTMQGAGGIGGLLAVIRDGEPFFPCYDANGNITEYLDTNGVIVAHYEYDPFGNIIIESGNFASTFTHRFSTKPWCEVTGLSEYEYRKYSPSLGRWLSRDPIGEEGFELFSNRIKSISEIQWETEKELLNNLLAVNPILIRWLGIRVIYSTEQAYCFIFNNTKNHIDPFGLTHFTKCWRKCIKNNYGKSFDIALGLSYFGVVQIAQNAYVNTVEVVSKQSLKNLTLVGAFTDGDIVNKMNAAQKAATVAKSLSAWTKVLSLLSKTSSVISAGATGYVIGASIYCAEQY